MHLNRVVITGVGAVTPFGTGVESFINGLANNKSCVKYIDEWAVHKGLRCLVAAPVDSVDEKQIPRQFRRTMGRMSIFAVLAAVEAVLDAGIEKSCLSGGRAGCCIGSTTGSSASICEAMEILISSRDIAQLPATKFFQCVSHSASMNVAQYLTITGSVLATSAACASGLQAVGVGYDLIRLGTQDIMLCGGAEELHYTTAGSFDILFATSIKYNQQPNQTPRPFDADRDGLVCGEGSGVLVLESYTSARKRNAKIYGEIVGYKTCGNASHVSQSDKKSMICCMTEALGGAGLKAKDIGYINAHATATRQGDAEEARAIREVFGDGVPASSLKGYIGHTLGASGAVELIAALKMMQEGIIYPTLNLNKIDPECAGIGHVTRQVHEKFDSFLKNCFAFGGISSALVCKKID